MSARRQSREIWALVPQGTPMGNTDYIDQCSIMRTLEAN